MRGLCALAAVLMATCVQAQEITAARFAQPTERYGHAVLGDTIEYGALEMVVVGQGTVTVELPLDHVFEDIAPRLWDMTGDGQPEVVVVETDMNRGGALAVYGPSGKIAETPHIGTRNRWLAPVGAADMDGDGKIEVAFVDRPHLAKTLRIWRFNAGKLVPVADFAGVTNHRIGEDFISGGLRSCAGGPEMVLATANWSRLVGLRFTGSEFEERDLGSHQGQASFAAALACE